MTISPIIVIGAMSTIGRTVFKDITKALGSERVIGTYHAEKNRESGLFFADIEKPDSLDELFGNVHPKVVINFAALADVFACETYPEKAEALNVKGAQNVAETCKKYGTRMIQISTDYVFDGTNGPYNERARPNPINVYGATKLRCEQECYQTLIEDDLAIVRLSHVYDGTADALNTGMLNLSANGTDTLEVPSDIITTPTPVHNIAPFFIKIIEHNEFGLFHLSGGKLMSWFDLSVTLADKHGIDRVRILPVRSDAWRREQQTVVRWPLNGGLISTRHFH